MARALPKPKPTVVVVVFISLTSEVREVNELAGILPLILRDEVKSVVHVEELRTRHDLATGLQSDFEHLFSLVHHIIIIPGFRKKVKEFFQIFRLFFRGQRGFMQVCSLVGGQMQPIGCWCLTLRQSCSITSRRSSLSAARPGQY